MKKEEFKPGKYTQEELEKILNRQRVRVLSKFVDKNYTDNPDYIDKIEWFMNGNIREEIIAGLDDEFKILRDDPDDKDIANMIDEKVIKFINKLYPQKNFNEK